ncbi:hypothetical protein ACFOGI_12695 [Virgibacillus xinjiangensis]|uniref:Uncharacterized protein n=1 Tax=Virgibacillus xinjiangensis TaxID=393090 RepID=A0ABV7CXW0_9BACI
MTFLVMGIIFFAIITIIIFTKRLDITTSAMAVVMSLGIVTQGVLARHFHPQLPASPGKYLSLLDMALWLAFLITFAAAYFNGNFKKRHYDNPMNRFGFGTWVAGTSICGILLYNQFPQWSVLSEITAWLNMGLWMIYMIICGKTLHNVSIHEFRKKAHGILLLTTVGTQSMILLVNTVFTNVPDILNAGWMSIGLCFYLICSTLIIQRYLICGWNLERDWNNTNCILHGALSITGIAWLKADIRPDEAVNVIWMAALAIFMLVEMIEIRRLLKRVRSFGVKQGIFVYDVTQWSRIFTFAMFYTFTSFIDMTQPVFSRLKEAITTAGVWVILFLVLLEIMLSLHHMFLRADGRAKALGKEDKAIPPV